MLVGGSRGSDWRVRRASRVFPLIHGSLCCRAKLVSLKHHATEDPAEDAREHVARVLGGRGRFAPEANFSCLCVYLKSTNEDRDGSSEFSDDILHAAFGHVVIAMYMIAVAPHRLAKSRSQ
jgi:hypothetical protein